MYRSNQNLVPSLNNYLSSTMREQGVTHNNNGNGPNTKKETKDLLIFEIWNNNGKRLSLRFTENERKFKEVSGND